MSAPSAGKDAVGALLVDETPEDQVAILQEMLDRRYDPRDPMFEFMRVLKLTAKLNAQTIAVSENIPRRLDELLNEIDDRFDARAFEWRKYPPIPAQVSQGVHDALADALPQILIDAQAGIKEALQASVEQELAAARAQFTRSAAVLLQEQAKGITGRAVAGGYHTQTWLDVPLPKIAIALLVAALIAIGGMWFGASRARVSGVNRQTEAMIQQMPTAMRTWVANYRRRTR